MRDIKPPFDPTEPYTYADVPALELAIEGTSSPENKLKQTSLF